MSEAFLNPLSTLTCVHIHSAYNLVILFSFRNMFGDRNSEDPGH